MKKTKKFLTLILTIGLLFLLGGCDDEDNGEGIIEPDITAEPTPEPLPFPVIIGGVEVAESPLRAVSLSPSLTEIIGELGYTSRIIGRGTFCDYPPAVLSLPDAGSAVNPDIDRIISLSPSLVLTTTPLSSRDTFRLEQAGVTVLVLPVGGGLSDLRDVYSAVGLAFEGIFTGVESGQEAFSVISRACDNKDVVNLGKFIYITGDFKAATGDTLEDAILSCFGENLASGGEDYEFDFSLLLENQPDIILLSNKFTEDDLLEEEYLSRLDAVSQGRIIFIDNSFFERPSARLTWLIDKMLADYAAMGR